MRIMTRIFEQKVVLVTGGSRGIGRAISLRLADTGAKVVINYLSDHESAEATVKDIESKGGQAIAIQAHLGDESSRADLWSEFDKRHKQLDYLVFNAATGVFREATKLTLKSLRKVFAVNFDALVDLANQSVQRMPDANPSSLAGSKGRIVAISSVGAEKVIANYGAVGSSKAAMEAMIRQLAFELGPKGINCNVVRAGLVDTGVLNYIQGKEKIIHDTVVHTPNGRLVVPEDVAAMVSFILSNDAAMVNGQTLMVDGGFGLKA